MPTVFRFKGWRVMIYTLDHLPPHVHVIGTQGEAIFVLHEGTSDVELRESFGIKNTELREIAQELLKRFSELASAWRKIHDQ